jgi:anti-sigma regulatory factor (Ser/Thr protein kinase)
LHDALTEVEYRFCVENDPSLVPQMVAFVQENLKRMRLCDQTERIRLGIALEEALLNGLYHGNLELSSQLREEGNSTFEALGRERRGLDPYRNRRLYLSVRLSMAELRFTVRDEGPGFDVSQIPDATNPEHMMRASGRGLLLIRSFMDEVQHNPIGNEITMIRRNKV